MFPVSRGIYRSPAPHRHVDPPHQLSPPTASDNTGPGPLAPLVSLMAPAPKSTSPASSPLFPLPPSPPPPFLQEEKIEGWGLEGIEG
ncbi:hypothetical protein GQ55_2G050600 [Panicum hallii var. hallii]|uniref:Uncharacterized protein n=1 Tax=Panicum hallii var. hallii TaxID=1504633 RepID=A0A2T7ELJ7_9POAL|nr:hypothetical protein GQ55_2G050600 [Panicum hallii var. hallii]